MRAVKDGWHKVGGHDVYVEDGRVLRGTSDDGQKTIYPYRWLGEPYNSYSNASGITLNALRSGLKRGTIKML